MGSKESYEEPELVTIEEKRDEKSAEVVQHHIAFRDDEVDSGAQLVAGGVELDHAEAVRIRKKIDWHILPLMCSEYFSEQIQRHCETHSSQPSIGSNSWIRQRSDQQLFSEFGGFALLRKCHPILDSIII